MYVFFILGKFPYWEGSYNTDTYTAKVRARAWREYSLPPTDFQEQSTTISTYIGRWIFIDNCEHKINMICFTK